MTDFADVLWSRIPATAARWSRTAAAALADGRYLVAWPSAAAALPPAALLLGFIAGWVHPGETFTYSIALLALMLVVSSAGAALGAWTLTGYAVADFFLARHAGGHSFTPDAIVHVRAPLLISYVLLGMLLVSIPLASSGLRLRTTARLRSSGSRTAAGVAVQAAVAAALVLVWTLSVPTLIRPVFTWQGSSPPTDAIQPLQQHGNVLIMVAAIAAIGRLAAEHFASASLRVRPLRLPPAPPASGFAASRELLRTIGKALFITFMVAGILTSWFDAILFAISATLIMGMRSLFARALMPWSRLAVRVPVLIRMAVAVILSYALARVTVGMMWNSTSTFRPVTIGTIVSLLVFTLLMPESRRTARSAG